MSCPFPRPVNGLAAGDQVGTAPHLKSLGVTRAGSSPAPGTRENRELRSGMDLARNRLGNNVASLRNTLLVRDTGPLQHVDGTAQISLG